MKETSSLDRIIGKYYLMEKSAQTISDRLRISLDKVYRSLRRQNIPRRSAAVQNQIRFRGSPLSFKFKEDLSDEQKKLSVSALMLYLGEGAKTGNTVDFVNSDTRLLKVFIKFLREVCRVRESKLRIYLYCFSDQDAKNLIRYWADTLRIPSRNFTKPYIRKIHSKTTRRAHYGVVHIRYSDKRLLEKMLSLCEELVTQLLF